ncbi:MAG: hypothetical protein KDH96_05670 [Candidatus Riesia sp.]|nr:hypothetical protein [Candidatus Riesia sp.]
METKIMDCTCKHVYQDEVYGKNKRVYNVGFNKKTSVCTVCSKEHVSRDK